MSLRRWKEEKNKGAAAAQKEDHLHAPTGVCWCSPVDHAWWYLQLSSSSPGVSLSFQPGQHLSKNTTHKMEFQTQKRGKMDNTLLLYCYYYRGEKTGILSPCCFLFLVLSSIHFVFIILFILFFCYHRFVAVQIGFITSTPIRCVVIITDRGQSAGLCVLFSLSWHPGIDEKYHHAEG